MSELFQNPDLHLHSVWSDGTDTLPELLDHVKAAGVDVFSLTDHDSYAGCDAMRGLLRAGDPFFIGGVELSCRDAHGKYHILGYAYSLEKPALREAVDRTHAARCEKARNRMDFLENTFGYAFTAEERAWVNAHNNPGRPHIVELMMKKGYVREKTEGFAQVAQYHGGEFFLSPEEAIEAILASDGIPVLAHGILSDGATLLTEEQIEARVARLKAAGLMGLECYYSGYTPAQQACMLSLAERYHLSVTAGSDYHGTRKPVRIGETHGPDPQTMKRFYDTVALLL